MKTIQSVIAILGMLLAAAASASAQPTDEYIRDHEIKLKTFEELTYPNVARSARVQGAVVIRLSLNEQGGVLTATALSGSPLLVPDAVSNARRWTFTPGPAKAAVLVYVFDFDGGCSGRRSFFRIGPHTNVVRVSTCADWTP